MELELRMYGLVPYNISPIQQGIQFGHSKDEYTIAMFELLEKGFDSFDSEYIKIYKNYKSWLKTWKTYIILNGGTTNNNPDRLGTLNSHLFILRSNGVYCTEFYEPDLGDQLTGVDFLVDERVFGKNDNGSYKWLEFEDWIKTNDSIYPKRYLITDVHRNKLKSLCRDGDNELLKSVYNEWVVYMGGHSNAFLRDYLKPLRLA